MATFTDVLDELMKNYKGPDDITGTDGLLKQLSHSLNVSIGFIFPKIIGEPFPLLR
jgi:hypothetical protein